VNLARDNFGIVHASFASLSMLSSLPLYRLAIELSFVRKLDAHADADTT
jgi:predicted signal transduction protein with EAL and GGDEF domain